VKSSVGTIAAESDDEVIDLDDEQAVG